MQAQCAKCGKADAKLRCSQCRIRHYCDRGCQKADWAVHKQTCKTPPTSKACVQKEYMSIMQFKPGPKDPHGRLLKLGHRKMDFLHKAVKSADGSPEQAEALATYESMAREEMQAWEKLDEPAGVAKALQSLAMSKLQFNNLAMCRRYLEQAYAWAEKIPKAHKNSRELVFGVLDMSKETYEKQVRQQEERSE